MFNKKATDNTHRKSRGGGLLGIFRVFLSLVVISVMLFALLLSLKRFSNFDPALMVNTKFNFQDMLKSEKLYKIVTGALSVDPRVTLKALQDLGTDSSKKEQPGSLPESGKPAGERLFSFAVVADSHNDNAQLVKALQIAKERGAEFVIGLGDYTDVGTIDELRNSKNEFDRAGLKYFVTAGDHDLWDSRNKGLAAAQNFQEVFGSAYSSFGYKGIRFVLLFNSDNYLGIDGVQEKWLEDQLRMAKETGENYIFIMTGIPLYHPSSDHFMGKVTPELKTSAQRLIDQFKQSGVAEVFAGDAHSFSRYSEPGSGLKMTVVGALTSLRNTQASRFVLVDVYSEGSYNIQDMEVK